jgi:hypothetical protein
MQFPLLANAGLLERSGGAQQYVSGGQQCMASQNARMEDQIAVCRLFAAYLKVQCEWSCLECLLKLGQQ